MRTDTGSSFVEALSLAADLLANHPSFDPSSDKSLAAVVKLALCLERDGSHRGGLVKQEPELTSLHRACIAVRSAIADLGGEEPSYEETVRWCIPLRCPVPEIAIKAGRKPPGARITDLGRTVGERASGALMDGLKRDPPDTTPRIGPYDLVVVEAGDPNDKIGQLDRAIDRSRLIEHIEAAWSKSGKGRGEFAIVIKPNLSMIFRLSDDGTYTDPVLVLRLIERIMERGFHNVAVVESQNLYGNWFANREVVKVAAHGGYLDRSVFDAYERGKRYFGHVLVRGEVMPFEVIDMTYDQVPYRFDEFGFGEKSLGRAWVEADYRINFAKFKTHFYTYYTVLVKNSYGCLPEQDKVKHYHRKLITHQLAAAQLAHFPVHFSFVDAISAADGILGAKMQADSRKPGLIFSGAPMLAVENVCAQMMGYDPYCSDFFSSAVETTGDLRAVRVEGRVEVLEGWRRSPRFVNDFSNWGQRYYRLGLHFGHTFTGHNDPCFPHTGRFIRLRRILSILPYPVLWLSNLDQLKVKALRRRLRRFCKKHADKLPLSGTDRSFFDLIYRLSLDDIATIADFLEGHGSLLADESVEVERFGHRVRVGDRVVEFAGMKHFAPDAAMKMFNGIRSGKFNLDLVRQELSGWRSLDIPERLRKHLLLDSPYMS